MSYADIVKGYLQDLKEDIATAESSGEATPELSFRGSLDAFFKAVASFVDPSVKSILEPRNQGKAGRPDWRFHNETTMGVYGYVEAKGLNSRNEIEISDYRSQIERYLELGCKVILTDGVDFVMFSPEEVAPIRFSLTPKPVNWNALPISTETEVYFRQFLSQPGYRMVNEERLIMEVAKRAKLLAENILELSELSPDEAVSHEEAETIRVLGDLKLVVQTQHDSMLQDRKVFAGFVAQVLTFGLLYAHRVIRDEGDGPSDRYKKIHDFWSGVLHQDYASHLSPFKELVSLFDAELDSGLSQIGTWYDDTRRLLAYVQLTGEQRDRPDYHTLYERFLAVFDPKTRFDYGAFYTPPPLATYVVALVESVAKTYFHDRSLYSRDTKIIDPCCGTATFIEALLERGEAEKNPVIIGFEILPTPYALAHYRMAMIGSGGYPDDLHILLTNTLSDALEREGTLPGGHENLIQAEQRRARELSRPPLTVIMGNPPSSDSGISSSREGERIRVLLNDFRPPSEERRARQNTQKQITNEYVKFLRWACDKLIASRPAIIAFVLPSSFARHTSYEYTRKWIADRFSAIWILNFDTDNRTGAGASNLFGTLQGRLLLVGITDEKSEATTCRIYYHSITNLSRSEKITYLTSASASDARLSDFREIPLDIARYSFRPAKEYDKLQYQKFWPISGDDRQLAGERHIFARHISGIKLAPTHLLVHVKKGLLKRRSRYISDRSHGYEDIVANWYVGVGKKPAVEKLTDNIRRLLGSAVEKNAIREYAYRPFVQTYVVLDDDLLVELREQKGGGTRDRPELRAAFASEEAMGVAIAPAPEDLGERLHRFASFCWAPPDNDIVARGNGHVFCNYFPDYKSRRMEWDPSPKLNVDFYLLDHIMKELGLSERDASEAILFYVYAVLCSEVFLEKFEGALFTPAGEYPRIPIVKNPLLFKGLADEGQKLAMLEREEFKPEGSAFQEKYHHLFHAGFKLKGIRSDVAGGTVELIDTDNNVAITLTQLPSEIIGLQISGYEVLSEWVKMHSYPYLRTAFQREHYEKFLLLLSKLNEQIKIITQLDELLLPVFEGVEELLSSSMRR